MGAKALRRQFLLSTTMLVGALTGYGGRAYGACVAGTPPNFICSGANANQQTITLDDATVSTVAGFSVVTLDPRAVSISGDGAISYTDVNYSPLTAATTALYIASNGDVPLGNPGSVTVDTNGTLTGGLYGILAFNSGSGALSVTANGDVTGTNYTGILARNFSGTDLSVTTGAGTTVTGGFYGIYSRNDGSGALTIKAYGDVEGTNIVGINARNYGTDLGVTTGVGTTVTGYFYGIRAFNYGTGALSVTADGDVTSTSGTGIFARNSTNGTDLGVTTGAGTNVTGFTNGIVAVNSGTGALTVTADGDVEGTNFNGIYARNSNYGTDLSVTTGAGTNVTGGLYGIFARNYGTGALTVTADGDVTGTMAPASLRGTLPRAPVSASPPVPAPMSPAQYRHPCPQLRQRRSDSHRRWRCHRHL
jgi:hypothetical protein